MNGLEKMLKEQNAHYIKKVENTDTIYLLYRPYKEFYNNELRVIGKLYHTIIKLHSDNTFEMADIDTLEIEKEFFNVD